MASASASLKVSQKIEAMNNAVKELQREQLLQMLGHPFPEENPIGDINELSSLVGPDNVVIEARDVPWLHLVSGCEGVKLYRHRRSVVSVPCYKRPESSDDVCCVLCKESFGAWFGAPGSVEGWL